MLIVDNFQFWKKKTISIMWPNVLSSELTVNLFTQRSSRMLLCKWSRQTAHEGLRVCIIDPLVALDTHILQQDLIAMPIVWIYMYLNLQCTHSLPLVCVTHYTIWPRESSVYSINTGHNNSRRRILYSLSLTLNLPSASTWKLPIYCLFSLVLYGLCAVSTSSTSASAIE